MKPKPWSFSALEDFKNCPRSYFEKRISKSVAEVKGEATIWGEQVHLHFEERLKHGVVLPAVLACHEEFLAGVEASPGVMTVEEKIALDVTAQPCAFFAPDVWFRGVVDLKKVNRAARFARLIDHKTGKHHSKFGQLKLFALHTFTVEPEVDEVRCEFYWTQTRSLNGQTYRREQIPALWAEFIPDLRQYAQAFLTDTWQPRQSGLCNGWCPVVDCEFWRPRRQKP